MANRDPRREVVERRSSATIDDAHNGDEPGTVPWVRTILQGKALLSNTRYNKDLAFSLEERRVLRLDGLLPPQVETQDEQMVRVRHNLSISPTPLDKYLYLVQLQNRNKKLFYRAINDDIEGLLPCIYTPTIGKACLKFGHLWRQPAGMYISLRDAGRVAELIRNWPEPDIRCIVVTDGERILGLGDLGANGAGIPLGKLVLYTACAGVNPHQTLPVMLDVGTNNKGLLEDPLYMGLRHERLRGAEYDALVDEFISAARAFFGPLLLIQFEDFGNSNAFRLLEKYRHRCTTFNDDIQGTAAVVLGGLYAATRLTGVPLSQGRYLVFGAGEAGLGIAHLISLAIAKDDGVPADEARRRIFLVDSKGLVTADRPSGGIDEHKAHFAHAEVPHMGPGLEAIVDLIKPTAIIGVTAIPQTFTQGVCERMAAHNERPIIFALSNPTDKAECTAEQAYSWTGGRAIYASGSPFDPVTIGGQTFVPGQCNNSYIFPGLAHGVMCCKASRVTDAMFLVSARTLADQVLPEHLAEGRLFPPLREIRRVSREIAAAVVTEAYTNGFASHLPRPDDPVAFVRSHEWTFDYHSYV